MKNTKDIKTCYSCEFVFCISKPCDICDHEYSEYIFDSKDGENGE